MCGTPELPQRSAQGTGRPTCGTLGTDLSATRESGTLGVPIKGYYKAAIPVPLKGSIRV